jgi:hypothetical protein
LMPMACRKFCTSVNEITAYPMLHLDGRLSRKSLRNTQRPANLPPCALCNPIERVFNNTLDFSGIFAQI